MYKQVFILMCLFTLIQLSGLGQSNVQMDTMSFNNNSNSLNNVSNKLIKSISENKTDEEIAGNYFALAMELAKNNDYIKAEIYINKAIQFESKVKKSLKLTEYYRELAKIQEKLNKLEIAYENYKTAASLATNKIQKQMDENDANRIKNKSNPEIELKYLNQNATLLNSTNNNYEKFQNLTQMATTNQSLNQTDKALENYKQALSVSDSTNPNTLLIKNNIVNILAESNNIDKAINLQKEVVEQSQYSGVDMQVQQMRNLSSLYINSNKINEGLSVLQNAYTLALEKENVKEARSSLIMLADYYEKNKENLKVLNLYKEFIDRLESLITNDNSLIDKNLFLINEERITQLEKEKNLKDELIDRKNRYNYVLIGSILLLFVLLIIIAKAWVSINKRNKRIALQSLRREMNPHFIFNSLNSVNQFIAENNELEANKYLTSYSNLMRNMMENSNKDYVSLHSEIEQLKKYLELEKLRFADKFEYGIEIDENVDIDSVEVPNMIIQPNLENAIWHGLRYKETKGWLKLRFEKEGTKMTVIIEDNGIGLNESHNIKTKNQKIHESRGLKNVRERIRLLNQIYNTNIIFDIKEKSDNETGVIVLIKW